MYFTSINRHKQKVNFKMFCQLSRVLLLFHNFEKVFRANGFILRVVTKKADFQSGSRLIWFV